MKEGDSVYWDIHTRKMVASPAPAPSSPEPFGEAVCHHDGDPARFKADLAKALTLLEKAMGKHPFDGRYEWMEDGPEDIKGHDPNVHQVALCLGPMIREAYSINKVPTEVVRLLHDCESSCRLAEGRVKLLIETVSNDLKPETVGEQYHQMPSCPVCGKPTFANDDGRYAQYEPCGCRGSFTEHKEPCK